MTLVITIGSPAGVVMAADTAVRFDFADVREYGSGRKLWHIPNVGFVSTWGARDANNIGQFLRDHWSDPGTRGVEDLARSVNTYLVTEYRPEEMGAQDVGFHIAGLYPDRQPAMFHAYFNTARDAISRGHYDFQHIGPRAGTQFLFNGRNDLAHPLIEALINEAHYGADPQFRGESIAELAHLAHFVLRVATEITPSVGAPYIICAKHANGREVLKPYEQLVASLSQFQCDFAP